MVDNKDLISEQEVQDIRFWLVANDFDITDEEEIKDLWIKFSNEEMLAGCMVATEGTIFTFIDWLKRSK